MKLLSLVLCAAIATPAFAQDHAMPASPAFDQLKPLIGEWQGQTKEGKPIHVSYELVSGGSALLERLGMADEPEMVTVYSPDNGKVAVTHFCSAGNQPRMETGPVTGTPRQLSFSFVSATNLASPTAGHMDHLTVTMKDHDHFSEAWTWKEKGQSRTEVFNFERKS